MCKSLVRHEIGTSELKTPDGSEWISYWKIKTGLDIPPKCPCCGENKGKSEFVGAHVYKYIDEAMGCNRPKYITPTCKSCNDKYKNGNSSKKRFEVENEMLLPV